MKDFIEIDAKASSPFAIDRVHDMTAYVAIDRDTLSFACTIQDISFPVYFFRAVYPSDAHDGLQRLINDLPILSFPFRSTEISFQDDSPFVVIPEDLTSGATPSEWLSIAGDISNKEPLCCDFDEEQLRVIYSIPLDVYGFCSRSFSMPHFGHSLLPHIRISLRNSRIQTKQLVSVIYESDQLQVVVACEGSLLLANRYSVAGLNDILYYITAIYRQFKLDPSCVPLYLYSSHISPQLTSDLRQYISTIAINEFRGLEIGEIMAKQYRKIPPHTIWELLCE
mgnify:CR=1 FL=1